MSTLENVQMALEHVLDVLIDADVSLEEAIARIAPEYDVKPMVVRSWVDRRFSSKEALDLWRSEAREAKAKRGEWDDQLSHLKLAANEWAQGVWNACEPDGQPDWHYCCERFLMARNISDEILKREAIKIFSDTGRRFNKARLKYLSEQ